MWTEFQVSNNNKLQKSIKWVFFVWYVLKLTTALFIGLQDIWQDKTTKTLLVELIILGQLHSTIRLLIFALCMVYTDSLAYR